VLHNAVNTGSVKMVRMLLDFGVDKTIKNFSGKTPLETAQNNMQTYAGASMKSRQEIVNLLENYSTPVCQNRCVTQ
ncbi:MAG TPA: ankyrin repeat domain-containing protein, partial [Candidatus Saccharimonadales bacterium]|nr:ankyrin repeat domain-containing protein [Candidatus Saccharimonadales bacterium]